MGTCVSHFVPVWPAGSDDGRVYIWDARSGAIICALDADEDIVNSVAAHPTLPYLATSGIEDKVRIWGPRSNAVNQDLTEQIQRNQVSLTELRALPTDVSAACLLHSWDLAVSPNND